MAGFASGRSPAAAMRRKKSRRCIMGISIRAPNFLTTRGTISESAPAEWRLIYRAAMNAEFVQEIVEEERDRYMGLTGWEGIVFQVEDDPESFFSALSTAAIAP